MLNKDEMIYCIICVLLKNIQIEKDLNVLLCHALVKSKKKKQSIIITARK